MEKANITAVSYLNTLPFVYGMRAMLREEEVNVMLDVPAECARKILENEVDFGLAPAGILPMITKEYKVMDYCIAADGVVDTVMLYSQVPMDKIAQVHLDADSRTSVLLVRLLALHLWKINPQWIGKTSGAALTNAESILAIGDKAFDLRSKYLYVWDLATAWKELTGLPFVFATWVAKNNVEPSVHSAMSEALNYGVSHVEEAIASLNTSQYTGVNISHYLQQSIQFRMNPNFQKGLDTYLAMIKTLEIAD